MAAQKERCQWVRSCEVCKMSCFRKGGPWLTKLLVNSEAICSSLIRWTLPWTYRQKALERYVAKSAHASARLLIFILRRRRGPGTKEFAYTRHLCETEIRFFFVFKQKKAEVFFHCQRHAFVFFAFPFLESDERNAKKMSTLTETKLFLHRVESDLLKLEN